MSVEGRERQQRGNLKLGRAILEHDLSLPSSPSHHDPASAQWSQRAVTGIAWSPGAVGPSNGRRTLTVTRRRFDAGVAISSAAAATLRFVALIWLNVEDGRAMRMQLAQQPKLCQSSLIHDYRVSDSMTGLVQYSSAMHRSVSSFHPSVQTRVARISSLLAAKARSGLSDVLCAPNTAFHLNNMIQCCATNWNRMGIPCE